MSENSTLTLFLMTLFCLAFAGGGAFFYLQQEREVSQAQPTNATVISSRTEHGSDDYLVDITYNYTVDGHTYESDDVYPGTGQKEKDVFKAEEIVSNYPEGKTVTAYYNPDNPSNSFLIKQKDLLMPLALVGIGGLVGLASGAALVRQVLGLDP